MSAYNVENYVRDAILGVLGQTFRDFELVVVEDGSSDATRSIIEAIAARDARVKPIYKNHNDGLAVARQESIAAATGEYVTFLDADDLVEPDLLERAVRTITSTRAEMVMWDYTVFTHPSQIRNRIGIPSALRELDPHDRAALLKRPAFAWTRMIRRHAAEQARMYFPPGLTYQDVPVHWRLVTQSESIALLPARLVHYRQRPTATTQGQSIKRADLITALDLVGEYLKAQGLYDTYRLVFLSAQLNAFYGVYEAVQDNLKPTVLEWIRARLTTEHAISLDELPNLRWQARDFHNQLHGHALSAARLKFWRALRSVYRSVRISVSGMLENTRAEQA